MDLGQAAVKKVCQLLGDNPARRNQFKAFIANHYVLSMPRFENEWAQLHLHDLPAQYTDRILSELWDNGLRNGPENHVKVNRVFYNKC